MPATNQEGARTPTGTRSIVRVLGSSRTIALAAAAEADPDRASGNTEVRRPLPDSDAPHHSQRAWVDLHERPGLPGRHPDAAECREDVERHQADTDAADASRRGVDP
jgi:hypothetical protein